MSPDSRLKGPPILDQLRGGDRRSIGRVPHVVRRILKNPELTGALVVGLVSDDPIVRMRAADALEKVSRQRPALLGFFREVLLNEATGSDQQEVRWHMAQMLPRLELSRTELHEVVSLLRGYLSDRSVIVKVCAMQALAELALRERRLFPSVKATIEGACRKGTPAVRARGRKLLAILEDEGF